MSGRRPGSNYWRELSLPARIGYIACTVVAVAVVVASLGAYAIYRRLDGNISVVKVSGLSHRSVYGPQNILILGSQTRNGQRPGDLGSNPSLDTSNSDNLILVHLNLTHTHAIVLSIPRDTIVYEPGCQARRSIGSGIFGPYQQAIIDGAMNIGGPSCAVKTVDDLTGVTLDHFVEFNFNSFRAMVDTIGGVEVCVPRSGYHDPYSGLSLSGGKHLLTYNQALAYVRTRHGVQAEGDVGGDLPRIELQQAFMSSVIQKVNTTGLLTNSVQLLKIADLATRALTVDQGLDSASKLLTLARSLTGLHARNVTLLTMPTVTDPANVNRLLPEEPEDDVIFQILLDGQPWTGRLPVQAAGQVRVRVLNGTGTPGLAAQTARQLRTLGFDVIGTGDAPATSTTTVSYAGTAQADGAYTLMTRLKSAPAAQNTLTEPAPQTGVPGPVTLTLGADFAGVLTPSAHHGTGHPDRGRKATSTASPATAATSGNQATVQARNAGASICSGLPQANPDPGAP
ncbi:MAG TPA: LCP family protein [Streptosporangiaceae bacterium]|nr:LCP family protein [Streptosporangiaceae bacterium]